MTKFRCYFPAESPLFISITSEKDDLVFDLALAIEADLHKRRRTDIIVDDLRLFKVNLISSSANN